MRIQYVNMRIQYVKKNGTLEYYKQLLRDFIHCKVTFSQSILKKIIKYKNRKDK
jgi:hypothetical protein